METPNLKIKTQFIYPPIPIRCFDWIAFVDGEEEAGQYGNGSTEQEAIQDLQDMISYN